jgi:hypothetical protein
MELFSIGGAFRAPVGRLLRTHMGVMKNSRSTGKTRGGMGARTGCQLFKSDYLDVIGR